MGNPDQLRIKLFGKCSYISSKLMSISSLLNCLVAKSLCTCIILDLDTITLALIHVTTICTRKVSIKRNSIQITHAGQIEKYFIDWINDVFSMSEI